MTDSIVQTITAEDVAQAAPLAAAILALNNSHAQELSWLDPARLEQLVAQSFLARRIGCLDAFVLALDQDASYDSPNFLWFRDHYRRFVYIDRIVVAAWARGLGFARLLYGGLFDAFHAALGFVEVGRASIHDGSKTVRYLQRTLEVTDAR
jgi:predicted GNAT superfamily acetyltransferase